MCQFLGGITRLCWPLCVCTYVFASDDVCVYAQACSRASSSGVISTAPTQTMSQASAGTETTAHDLRRICKRV